MRDLNTQGSEVIILNPAKELPPHIHTPIHTHFKCHAACSEHVLYVKKEMRNNLK